MKSVLQSLLIVSLILVFVVLLSLLYLKIQDSSTQFHPLESPFFSASEKPLHSKFKIFRVASPPIDPKDLFNEPQTRQAFDPVETLDPQTIVWVDVQFTKDHIVVAKRIKEFRMPRLQNEPPGPPVVWTRYLDLAKIQQIAPQTLTLQNLFDRFPQRRWILNIVDYSPDADLAITKEVNDGKAGDRVVITSEQDRSLADIRKIQPMWLYGSSRAQITQLLFMNTLHLDALANIRADLYITALKFGERSLVDADVVSVIHRRGLRIFVGPVESEAELESLKSIGPDGLISSRPDFLKNWTSGNSQ
jgi:glycerophosphoryl diester phosphodiesterase